jgi:methyl-accepting chemotaxis protein
MDVLRRTTGAGATSDEDTRAIGAQNAAQEASLWASQEQAAQALAASTVLSERVATTVARQRTAIDAAAERASLMAARSEGLSVSVARITEAFDRLGVVALNAGLEGARVAEPQGRALLLLSEEIRANVSRGADAARDLRGSVEEIASEAGEVRRSLERSRGEASEVGEEAAKLSAASQQAARSLEDLAQRLRKATGMDPDVARAIGMASEHARGLMTALSTLSTAAPGGLVAGALRPVIAPLVRLLSELGEPADSRDKGESEGGAP